tara:strand:+ start:19877 stop:21262 length:1386 start_codon:yes stop_codon:yes gene_type:complete
VSKKNRHIEHLTPELIKAYRNGELTREEQHEVERLMLENPLYNEALEGLDEFTDEMLDADLNELDNRLDELLAEEDRPAGFWTIWRGLAAALILVVIVGTLFILRENRPLPKRDLSELQSPEKEDTLTKPQAREPVLEQGTKSETNSIKQKKTIDSPKSEVDEKLEGQLELNIEPKQERTQTEIARIDASSKQLALESMVFSAVDSQLIIPMDKVIGRLETTQEMEQITQQLSGRVAGVVIQDARSKQGFIAPAEDNPANITTLKGRVVDAEDQLPLPGVLVVIKGTTRGTTTNTDGLFQLNNIPRLSELEFRFLGYLTTSLVPGNRDSLNVKLQPDVNALGEIIVTGVSEGDEVAPVTIRFKAPQPEIGYPKFNRYLKENIRYPQAARNQNIKGVVTVEFTVEADGGLSNFKTLKGLGHGCDEEAIRLIKEGPQWQPKLVGVNEVPESSKVTLRIRFRPN